MKIAWAFNPFDENRKLRRKAKTLLKSLGRPVELFYVASPSETSQSVAFDVPEKERFTSYPKKLVNQASRKLGLKTSRVTVLTQNDLSLSSSVQNLTKYLAKKRFDITLVAS